MVLFANTDWYLWNFRLPLAQALRQKMQAEVIFLSPRWPFVPRLRAAGFQWREVPMNRRGMGPLAEFQTLWNLRRQFRELRPDLVHTFTLKGVVWGGLAARWAGVPRAVHALTGLGSLFTARGWRPLAIPVLDRFLRAAFAHPKARGIFQNPEDQALALRRGWLAPGAATLIRGSGVDPDRFRPSMESSPLRVVMVARLLRGKGVLDFRDLARGLHERFPEVRFELAGGEEGGRKKKGK